MVLLNMNSLQFYKAPAKASPIKVSQELGKVRYNPNPGLISRFDWSIAEGLP